MPYSKHNLSKTEIEYINDLKKIVPILSGIVFQYILSENGDVTFTYVGEGVNTLWGLEPEEAYKIGKLALARIHPDDQQEYRNKILRSNQEVSTVTQTFRVVHKDGITKWIQAISSPTILSNGNILRTGFVTDVTESKLKESEIKINEADASELYNLLNQKNQQFAKSRSNLITVLDMLPLGVFIKNVKGKFIYANSFYCELLGYDNLFSLQKYGWKRALKNKANIDVITKQDNYVLETHNVITLRDLEFTYKDNIKRYFDVTKSVFYISDNLQPDIIGIMHETTQQKNAEQEKKTHIDELTVRNRNLEQFSYIVSHNLRSPVTTILGVTQWMQKNLKNLDPTTESLFNGLTAAAYKVDGVIRDLNEILALQGKKQQETVVFEDVLDDVCSMLDNAITTNKIEVISNFEEAPEMVSIKPYIHSIFYNLISNSIKYREKKRQTVINVSSSQVENGIKLVFKDNGRGINMDSYGSMVFDLYKQFHGTNDGRGMGLFMVKTQVELLKGKIQVSSKEGEGTVMTIILNRY